MIEELIGSQAKVIKVWMTCTIVGGAVSNTQGAVEEGIIGVDWYDREQLQSERVFPSILLDKDWAILQETASGVVVAASRKATF